MFYHVDTSNRGDWAIKKSIVEAISKYIDVPFSFFSVKNDELTEQRILKQLNTDCSVLMVAGSGLYTNYPKSSGWYFPCSTNLFEKIKVPIILFGLGNNQNLRGNVLNDELKDETKKSIKLINDLAIVSTVRDKRTFNMLNNLGITKCKLLLDPGNFLEVPKVKKEKRVAIQIAQHAPILGRFDGTTELRTYNVNAYAEISNYLISRGYSVVFISHDALENSLIVDLKKLVPELEYLNSDNLDEMLKEYAKCQFSIGMKMHSNIMSFAAGTPFISVYYDVKTLEYLKMINWDYKVCVFDKYQDDLKWEVDYMISEIEEKITIFENLKLQHQPMFDKEIKNICNIIKTSI